MPSEAPEETQFKPQGTSLKTMIIVGIAVVFFLGIIVYMFLTPVDMAVFWVAFVFLFLILAMAAFFWFFGVKNKNPDPLLQNTKIIKNLYENPTNSMFPHAKEGTKVEWKGSAMFEVPLTNKKEILVYIYKVKGATNFKCSVLSPDGRFKGNVDTTDYDLTKELPLLIEKIRKIYDPYYISFTVPYVQMPRFDPNAYMQWQQSQQQFYQPQLPPQPQSPGEEKK